MLIIEIICQAHASVKKFVCFLTFPVCIHGKSFVRYVFKKKLSKFGYISRSIDLVSLFDTLCMTLR